MITCFLKYEVEMDKLADFEIYAKMWISLVEKFGGNHHGYFFPSEGASDIAYALFTFPSLADYEVYRQKAAIDEECQNAMAFYERTKCFRRYERSFLRPVFE